MRRAYIADAEPLDRALQRALQWAGATATIHAPDTASIDENGLDDLGVPVTCASKKSRFSDQPHGTVIGVFLTLGEVLEIERRAHRRGVPATVDGLIIADAYGPQPYFDSGHHHSPWITAYDVEHLGGQTLTPVPPAAAPLRAAIRELTNTAILNQGLLDKERERSEVIHALTYLRDVGVPLDPGALMVEALRNEWGGTGPEDFRQIAVDLTKSTRGKPAQLQYNNTRLGLDRLQRWAAATD